MLTELHIENFAIIDKINLQLGAGLIMFTGETGAGKSIVIDALETVLGGRADASQIRTGAERASVEGVFHIPDRLRSSLHPVLESEDLLDDPDYLILGREIRANGRNVCRVNGRTVSAALLRQVSEHLVDVHGQSEHLSLLRPSQHLGMLDDFAATQKGNSIQALLRSYRQTYQSLQKVRGELGELRQSERDTARRTDLLNYQLKEIESAHLRSGEEEELREERNRLANAEGLASLTQEALVALDEGTPEAQSVTDLFGQVTHALNGLARLDPSQTALDEQAQSLFDGLVELAHSLRAYLEGIEFNPKRLDQVEERLELIHNLKRKYGDSIEAVLAFAVDAGAQMETITHAGERILELEEEETALLSRLGSEGLALSTERHRAAEGMALALEAELDDLQMAGTQFKVDFVQRPDPGGAPLEDGQTVAFDANGLEKVEFLIAPNTGEGLKPLARIASGGETSRLMLAIKNVLARSDQVPTLVFDEIDQGIGGRVGSIVGQKLWGLAKQHQVLCITHLPQLAAFGAQHFHVLKEVQKGRTLTLVKPLDGEERVEELAQMLGGVSEGTLQSAREMVTAVKQSI